MTFPFFFERRSSMGKPIALFFACAALIILAGSLIAPEIGVASKPGCAPAYGVDPCETASITTGTVDQ
ncbi:hypothetical protein LCM4573_06905 [Rhizobium sp. LCM 4573]|nr:hypothetical protein LCM4573_06905 [Rhizobium sp. LCM 4573]